MKRIVAQGKEDFFYYTRARGHSHTARDITSWLPTMEFAEEEDYDKLEPSSYTGDIEFKAQADSEAIEDRTTEDPFRDTWGPDAQNIFAKEDDDDDDSWSESALIQEQLRKIRDRGDRLRADREARLLQQQNPPPPPPLHPPPPSGNHDHDHQYSQTNISSPEEKTPHIFDSSSPFTENMLPRLILLFFFLLLLFSAISTKKFSKPYKSRSKSFPKFIMNKINIHLYLPPPLHRLFTKNEKIVALPSPPSTKITSRLQFQFHLLYRNIKTIFPPLPTLQRHCFSLARKFLMGYIFLLLAAPFGKIALASYRNRVVLWRDLEGFEVPYYLLVEEERRGCW